MRRHIKAYLHASPRLFAAARALEIYTAALLRHIHDAEFRDIAAHVDPRVIADIGANLGQSITAFARLFPTARVAAFEPNPACAATIRTVVRLARSRTELHSCGLGSGAATLDFLVPVVAGTALLQEGSFDPHQFAEAVTIDRIGHAFTLIHRPVPVRRLDDFPDTYDVLKIDVQGFEMDVLRGATETLDRYHPLVFIENGPDTPAAAAYLAGFGYRDATPAGPRLNSIFVHGKRGVVGAGAAALPAGLSDRAGRQLDYSAT